MSYVRALSFRQIKNKDTDLRRYVCYLRKVVKSEVKTYVSSQLSMALHMGHSSSSISVSFWSKIKRFIKPSASSLHGFISPTGEIIKDPNLMCDLAADYYENFFVEQKILFTLIPT